MWTTFSLFGSMVIDSLHEFLDHINNQHKKNFTMEVEKDKAVPFLDFLVKRKTSGVWDMVSTGREHIT